uniref:BIRD-IDD transcription factor fourth C2HC zinc finger domain-containing protein n=1 Tax=Oryza brachyantha TaxID=4533 RepID=J3LY61_ORYBR
MHACRRDSFIPHRVFCDALAAETVRLNAASSAVAAAHVHHAARPPRRHVRRHGAHHPELPMEVDDRSGPVRYCLHYSGVQQLM